MLRTLVKRVLQYRPAEQTAEVRNLLNEVRDPTRPYCPDWEGDLIWSIIDSQNYSRCLETGFGTGSTAIYMLHAVEKIEGTVTSIDWSSTLFNEIGKKNLRSYSGQSRHTLYEEPSEKVLPQLASENLSFDFIYLDGWKTFDHLAMEIFFANKLLAKAGTIMLDDSRMNSVNKVIALLRSHYGYREIDYSLYNETWKLRLWHVLTNRSMRRPYRAFVKTLSTEEQPVKLDYRYFADF